MLGISFYNGFKNDIFLLGIGLFLTGIISTTFGQFLLNWESSFFDKVMSSNISIMDYIKSKLVLINLFSILGFALTLPYVFFDPMIFWFNLTATLYNIGVMPILLTFFSFYNTKKVALTREAFFNYEGVEMNQFIMIIAVFGLPAIFFWSFYSEELTHEGLVVLGLISLLALVFRNHMCVWLTRQFKKRKYKLSEEFRTE